MEEVKFSPSHMHAAMAALGSKKKATHIHIEPTDNGGYIASHHAHEDGMPTGGRIPKHALSSLPELIKHVKDAYADPIIDKVKAAGAEGEAGETKEPQVVRDEEQP